MLTRNRIEKFAEDYLVKNNYPIDIALGRVTLPEDGNDKYGVLEENGVAEVSFQSIYAPSNPFNELIPIAFIVYVDLITGEVHMAPRGLTLSWH